MADFHSHGKYSGATSTQMVLPTIAKWAKLKGLNLLGTGDITHPKWFDECKELLSNTESEETGIYPHDGIYWILSTEVSTVYQIDDHSTKKIHHVILFPNFEIVSRCNEVLSQHGKLEEDGRPTLLNFSSAQLVEELKEIDSNIEIIPAHVWTPWFSVYGSKHGYDSIKDCYEDQIKHVHCIETGLSSDPEMNWRLSELDSFTIISNSDSHSPWPWRMGREVTIFNAEPDYKSIIRALRQNHVEMTIEVDPHYGKYHFDGHRKCNVRLDPEESKKHGNICPNCHRPLTIGVLHRVEQLADRPRGYLPRNPTNFKRLLPFAELLKQWLNLKNFLTKQLLSQYMEFVKAAGNELNILLWKDLTEIKKILPTDLFNLVQWNRNQEIHYVPGYDGVYGTPIFPNDDNKKRQATTAKKIQKAQSSLMDFF